VNYYFDKLNLGGSLTALLYAYKTNTPIIIDHPRVPFELEDAPFHWDLRFLGFPDKLPVKKSAVWDRLSFLLSMAGLVIFPNNLRNFKLSDKTITVITTDNRKLEIRYDEVNIFDEDKENYYIVYDWFDVRSGTTHDHDVIYDYQSDFVKQLVFYGSRRSGNQKNKKDVCAISEVPVLEIDSIDHSAGYSRLKTLQMMKDSGIRGTQNGYNHKGKPLHYAVKIEHSHRELEEIINNKFKVEDLLKLELDKRTALWKLTQKFSHPQHRFISPE
jgi:hypothetical protein